ncbi:hypothetical protein HYX16_02670 [Candidatus Woesearchaeota archaeon]|nr:hypothetical protein [Candidatus Woesearchaeota archaeon]
MVEEQELKNENVIEKLKPFWDEYLKKERKFRKDISALEKKMTNELELNFYLEFFHVDNGCVGIGASNLSDRKKFPLINDSELNN